MCSALLSLGLLVSTYAADGSGGSDPPAADDTPVVSLQHPDWPFDGVFAERLWCIEFQESRHFAFAQNPYSGARGYLQWLPSTARTWGVSVGSRQSEWTAAARIHNVSESFFRSQWPVTARLCP